MTAHVPVPSIWTDQHVERLKQLNADGLSRSQIAGQLGEGFTRNSVIGKLHRLGIDGPPRSSKPRYKPASRRKRKPAKPRFIPIIEIVHDGQELDSYPCSLQELSDNTCRWPMGEPSEAGFHFCGGVPQSGSSYCASHHRIAHQKPQLRGHFRLRGQSCVR
jgi:GcrA cell cycle regulator